jgi:hypothetical protein
MGIPAWLQQLLAPYLKVLAPIAQQIGPEFHQIMRVIVAALDSLARRLTPLLHRLVDAVPPQLLVRCCCCSGFVRACQCHARMRNRLQWSSARFACICLCARQQQCSASGDGCMLWHGTGLRASACMESLHACGSSLALCCTRFLQASAAAVDSLLGCYRPWQIVLLAAGATLLLVTAAQVSIVTVQHIITVTKNSSSC